METINRTDRSETEIAQAAQVAGDDVSSAVETMPVAVATEGSTLIAVEKKPRRFVLPGGLGAGVGAALFMLLAMGLLRFISNTVSIPELMEQTLVTLTGGQLGSFFINSLGTGAKALLVVMVLEGTLLLGALLGILFTRVWPLRVNIPNWRLLSGVLYGLGIGLFLNAVFLPLFGHGFFGATALEATAPPDIAQSLYGSSLAPWGLPAWVAMMVLGLVFGLVLVRLLPWETYVTEGGRQVPDMAAPDEGRRGFLKVVAGSMFAIMGGAAAWGLLGRAFQAPPIAAVIEEGSPDAPDLSKDDSDQVRPTAESAQGFEDVKPRLVPEVTSTDTFYITTKNVIDPTVDGKTWRLQFKGMVDNPYSLTLDDIVALPSESRTHTLACISNGVGGALIGNGRWKGVSFAELVKRAKPQAGVVDVIVKGADGYTDSFSLDAALNNNGLLAFEMNGEPLNNKHGYPLRLLLPGIFGMKNCKWITEVEFVNRDHKGYWQSQGWSDPAPYLTMSRIDYPDSASIADGPIYIGGIAFAGERGIKRVEVSTDDGKSWGDAAVRPPLGKHTWVQWTFPWNPQPGSYTLKVRATDGKGEVQTAREQGTFPDGATGYHTRKVRVTEKSGRSQVKPASVLAPPTAVSNEVTIPSFEKPMYDY